MPTKWCSLSHLLIQCQTLHVVLRVAKADESTRPQRSFSLGEVLFQLFLLLLPARTGEVNTRRRAEEPDRVGGVNKSMNNVIAVGMNIIIADCIT